MGEIISSISGVMYGYILIILLVGCGIYFTIRTKGSQFRLKSQLKCVTEKPKDKKSVSSFQALMVSTASRVGTGNIIGVSTAICMGGFGSVFWMWIIALIGGASALVESTLAQIYKRKGLNGCYGGPAYYIETGLKSRWLAIVFSVLLILTYGVGFNMLASYNLQSTFETFSFYSKDSTPWIIGAIVAVLVGYCLIGGGKRIIKVTSFLVPIMGVAYILIALVIIFMNVTTLPSVFARIFTEAFDFNAIFGGFSGSCLMYGIKRGLYSNEAGVGSAPNAAASALVSHPVKQGFVQTLSVFIDTILVCSATAFMCMCSGVEASESISGAQYVQASLQATLGGFGPIFIVVAMVLFAFTTLIGNLFYVDKAIIHIFKKEPNKIVKIIYYILFSGVILVGAGLNSPVLWDVSDIFMGLMTMINIPVIIILGKYAFRAIGDYVRQKKQGLTPTFLAKNIGLPHKVDYWQGEESEDNSADEKVMEEQTDMAN
ncbi:MAG: alanine:cation symporter family protein [Clostridiales bacterium]|nr:alanine:cation symporter family protein [Clostridiales bacterium]